jgi:DNA primase
MDLIATFQAGVKNVVATSGTALTLKQLRLLKPFAETLIFSFDMDPAGQEAASRAYDLAQDFDYSIKVATFPEGKDPAEYAKNHAGGLEEIYKKAVSYGEYFYGKLIKVYGTDGLSSKRKIIHEFLPFFSAIKSSIEKDEFIRKLAGDLDLKESQIYDEIKNTKLPSHHPARFSNSFGEEPVKAKKYSAEELLLGLIINFPRIAFLLKNKMDEYLFSEHFKPIYIAFIDKYNDQRVEAGSAILQLLTPELRESAQVLSLYVTERYGEMSEEAVEKEISNLIDNIRKQYLNQKMQDLQKQIKEAERKGEKDKCNSLLLELSKIRTYGTN